MKTIHLAMIIGLGMILIVIGNSNLLFAQEGGFDLTGAKTYSIIDSPLKQFKSGISLDNITCNDGFFLAISIEKTPLCLKAGTISKLATRGFLYGINANENETNYTTVLIPPGSENQNSNKTYSPNIVMVTIGVNNTVRWVNQADIGNSVVSDTPVEQDGKIFSS
ncbi:MAG: hypothetical protein KGI28_10635, partial [Thaumarchaeota archaeon]|nr:hypothetical protein [Nitrososphaerota archaeon]